MKYKTQGSRVHGKGLSINCPNIVTAKDLCQRLNNYENTIQTLKQQITLQQDIEDLHSHITNIQYELNTIKELLR